MLVPAAQNQEICPSNLLSWVCDTLIASLKHLKDIHLLQKTMLAVEESTSSLHSPTYSNFIFHRRILCKQKLNMNSSLDISQSHRMVAVFGRHLWRLSSPIPLLKVGPTTEQIVQDHVLSCFQHLQGWSLQTSLDNVFQCLSTLIVKTFSRVQREFSVFQFVSITSCSFTRHH